jgi:hypothetical protein
MEWAITPPAVQDYIRHLQERVGQLQKQVPPSASSNQPTRGSRTSKPPSPHPEPPVQTTYFLATPSCEPLRQAAAGGWGRSQRRANSGCWRGVLGCYGEFRRERVR